MTQQHDGPPHTERSERRRPRGTRASKIGLLDRAFDCPLLTLDEERELLERWLEHRDSRALRRLVESHGRLVVRIASQFRQVGLPVEDLVQEGVAGLVQAIHRFDPGQGCRLSTYARWSIRAAIQAFIFRNWSSVHLTKAEQGALFASRQPPAHASDASPANDNRSARAAGSHDDGQDRGPARVRGRDLSLNTPAFDDEEREKLDLLADDRPSPEETAIEQLDRRIWSRRLRAALRRLPERERIIIQERHLSEERVGLRELGTRFGVSKERARQLEKRALEMLAAMLREKPAVNSSSPTPRLSA